MAESPTSFFFPDDYLHAPGEAPSIQSFTGQEQESDSQQRADSLQVAVESAVVLSWTVSGEVEQIAIDGAGTLSPSDTQVTVRPTEDRDYLLVVQNSFGVHQATVHVAVHEPGDVVSGHAVVQMPPAQALALVSGGDIHVNPPVRLLPQYDDRWAQRQLAGADLADPPYGLTWQGSGCGPSSAATVLRWFAEDCKAGRVPFPTKAGSAIDPSFYGPRMAQAFWPEAFSCYPKDKPGNPIGKVELNDSGCIDYLQLFTKAAKWLGKDDAHVVDSEPSGGWLDLLRDLLHAGPCIIAIGEPSANGHFVVVQGIRDGALLIADPGNLLFNSVHYYKPDPNNPGQKISPKWADRESVKGDAQKPDLSQWTGTPPGYETDQRGYVEVSGAVLDDVLSGIRLAASLSYPDGPAFQQGAPVQAPEPQQAAPLGDPDCKQCAALQQLIGHGVADKIKREGDKDSIELLQFHLVKFGYPLGTSGPGGDGVDGGFGDHTAQALAQLLQDLGASGGSDALSDDAATLILKSHLPPGFTRPAPKPVDPADEQALRAKILELAYHEAVELKVRTDKGECWDSGGRIDEYFRVAAGKVPEHTDTGARQYCAAFSAYCYKSAGAAINFDPWAPSLLENFRAEGRVVKTPQAGDLFFFRHKGAAPDAKGEPHHVGIVAKVEGGRIYTYEGNTWARDGNATQNWGVWDRDYALSGSDNNEFAAFASAVIPGAASQPAPQPPADPAPQPAPDPAPQQAAAPAPQPAPSEGACSDCDALQAMIDDGSVSKRIRRASTDAAAVKLLQGHLIKFDYDMGTAGADGKYYDGTKNGSIAFFGEIKLSDPDPDVLEADEARAVIEKCKAGFKTYVPPSTLGASLFAGLQAGALGADEDAFIVSLKGKTSDTMSLDDDLRSMRLVYKAYLLNGASPAAAAGLTAQFATESGYGRGASGKFNYFGIKESPRGKGRGTLCRTWEQHLSDAEIAMFQSEGHYYGMKHRDDVGADVHIVDDYFLDYASLADALQQQAAFIRGDGATKLYVRAWSAPTPEEYCQRVAAAGYAEEKDYAQGLIGCLKTWDNYAKQKKNGAVKVIQETANAEIDPALFQGGFP